MSTYKFIELSEDAQNLAVNKYLHGWYETHDENDLSYQDAKNILLLNDNDRYFIDGRFAEEV